MVISISINPFFGIFYVGSDIIFSIVRKDGLLVLNQGEGALLAALNAGQTLVLIYLASTLTACLVTLWSIGRELGWSPGGKG